MNTSIVTFAVIAVAVIILLIIVWKATHKNPDIIDVDIPEVTPEDIAKAAEEADEEKSECVIEKTEEEEEEDDEPVQTVEEYVAEVASKLVDSEGSLTSSKLEIEGQDSVLVITEAELTAANKKFEESLKNIGIDPVTGFYTHKDNRKTEETVKPNKGAKKSDKKTGSKPAPAKKETIKVNKSGRPIKKIEKKPANKKNNDARQNKAVNGKKNKKKPAGKKKV